MAHGGGGDPENFQPGGNMPPPDLSEILGRLLDDQRSQATEPGIPEDRESDAYLKVFKDTEEQRQRHREILTPALRNIAQIWVIAVLLLLVWQGFGSKIGFFHLSDKVLVTLLTTTTVNILGLFYIAVRYLYANPDFKSPRMNHEAIRAQSSRSPTRRRKR